MQGRSARLVWRGCLAAIVVIAAGCGGGAGGDERAAGETCKVGVIMPRSGSSAVVGQDNLEALRLLSKRVNGEGGLDGCGQLKFIVEDDQSTPTVGSAALQKLVNRDRVSAIIGPFNSNVAVALAPLANRFEVPVLVSGATTDTLLTADNRYMYRPNDGNREQGEAFLKYIIEELGWRRVAIVYQETDFGTSVAKVTEEAIRDAGGTVAGKLDFEFGSSNFLSLVGRLKSLEYDGIVSAALTAEMAPLLRAAGQAGIDGDQFAAFGMDPAGTIKLARRYADGVRTAQYYDPEKPANDVARKFISDYRAAYGKPPSNFAAEGYNSGLMLVAAIERGKTSDPKKIREALSGLRDVPTAFGPLTFDARGQATHPVVVQEIEGGKVSTIATVK